MATFKYEIFKDRKRIDGTYNVKIESHTIGSLKGFPLPYMLRKKI